MPTVSTTYKCDICDRFYGSLEDAQYCEDRGPMTEYPIGCIYGNHTKDGFYKNITFAVAGNSAFGHMNDGASWACRDNGAGDSLGEEKCGGSSLDFGEYESKTNPEQPSFKRMVKWLQSQKIEVTVWNGEKAVLLAEFLGASK